MGAGLIVTGGRLVGDAARSVAMRSAALVLGLIGIAQNIKPPVQSAQQQSDHNEGAKYRDLQTCQRSAQCALGR